jgi:peroxiredoxin
MAVTAFRGTPTQTNGELPKLGQTALFSKLVKNDLSEVNNETYKGKNKIIRGC